MTSRIIGLVCVLVLAALAACGDLQSAPPIQSEGSATHSAISVAIDFASFVSANGATYERTFDARELTISDATARQIALDETSGVRILMTEAGTLTWPQSGLDRRQVWLVFLAPPGISSPTEYLFIDGKSGMVRWKFGSE